MKLAVASLIVEETYHHRLQEANFTLREGSFVLATRGPVLQVAELIA